MSKLSPRQSPRNEQRQLLRRIGEITATLGAALAGVFMLTQVSDVTTMQYCDTCTMYITDANADNLKLNGGEVVCITATGSYRGNLTRKNNADTIRIVNEGIFEPNNLNFNHGVNLVENHGVANFGSVNYNQALYSAISNHSNGQMEAQTFNLRNGGYLYNAGTFTVSNLNFSDRSLLVNDTTGMLFSRGIQVNGGSTVRNHGTWDISQQGLTLNSGSTWINSGVIDILTTLTVNSQSILENTGRMSMGQDMIVNDGEITNRSILEVVRDFTLNGDGNMYHEGSLEVGEDLIIGGRLAGPAGAGYGVISIVGQTTIYGSSQIEDNIDLCDQGQPVNGIDNKWGTPGANVTYCEHTVAGPPSNLPIVLTGFGAEEENGQVALWWETSREENNHYFTVERSLGDRTFESVGRVEGAGNSDQPLRYAFMDQAATGQGKRYYRLRQTDYDGTTTYSSTVEVTLQASIDLSARLYPIPAREQVTLAVNSPTAQAVVVQVSTMRGELVRVTSYALAAGSQTMSLPLGDVSPGLYLVNVLGANGQPLLPGMKLVKQ
jgi:hypothetical protein